MAAKKQWIVRLICLLIVLAALFAYQARALQWEEETAENRAAIESAEAYNQEVLEAQKRAEQEEQEEQEKQEIEESAEPDDSDRLYEDGRYSGTGTGFGGEIAVTVTISDDTITAIDIDEADGEDDAYFSIAQDILDDILAAQSAEVDTITGATFSSTGIRDAVQDALDQAKAG